MPMYRVEWAIDIEAATPREAAEKARAAQQFPREGYWCGVFDVTEHGADTVRIDLDEPEENEPEDEGGWSPADIESASREAGQ